LVFVLCAARIFLSTVKWWWFWTHWASFASGV